MMFVVRDWINDDDDDDYPYGFEGGKKYLTKTLEKSQEMEDENKYMKNFFKSFDEIPCCLLPHPGPPVNDKNRRQHLSIQSTVSFLYFFLNA